MRSSFLCRWTVHYIAGTTAHSIDSVLDDMVRTEQRYDPPVDMALGEEPETAMLEEGEVNNVVPDHMADNQVRPH